MKQKQKWNKDQSEALLALSWSLTSLPRGRPAIAGSASLQILVKLHLHAKLRAWHSYRWHPPCIAVDLAFVTLQHLGPSVSSCSCSLFCCIRSQSKALGRLVSHIPSKECSMVPCSPCLVMSEPFTLKSLGHSQSRVHFPGSNTGLGLRDRSSWPW